MLRALAAAAPPIALILVGILLIEPPVLTPGDRLPTLRVLSGLGDEASVPVPSSVTAPDQSTARSTAEALIRAADTGDTQGLSALCPPYPVLDRRVRDICALTPQDPRLRAFAARFGGTRVGGEPDVAVGSTATTARVGIVDRADGRPREIIRMARIDEKWYLVGL